VISPKTIKLRRAENLLEIQFDHGTLASLPAEYLRVESPSAEVRGHGPDQKRVQAGKRHVRITGIEPTGNYAIRLLFSDGHDTGIFSWDYLYRLHAEYERRWAEYLNELEKAKLTRG
jgi:DUF971 family protein